MHVFTHFDARYRPFGQALLESLLKFHPNAVLHVLPLDDGALFAHPSVRFHALSDVLQAFGTTPEDLRRGRSYRDVCWLLEPIWCWYAASQGWDTSVLYLDADSYLFSPLTDMLKTAKDKVIGLCPHHFPNPERELLCGRYNFGCGWFKCTGTVASMLKSWAKETLGVHAGYGGQRLLDKWPQQLGPWLHEFPETVNCGPWQLPGVCDTMLNGNPLVTYHFHELRPGSGHNPIKINGKPWNLTNYPVSETMRMCVYEPYLKTLEKYV